MTMAQLAILQRQALSSSEPEPGASASPNGDAATLLALGRMGTA